MISRIIIMLLLIFLEVNFIVGKSPSRLELIHADFSRGRVENGQSLKILEGNVHARQDSLELFCDRAVYLENQKKLVLEGHVILKEGKKNLTAKNVTYFENKKLAIAEDSVHLWKENQEIYCNYLEYYYETDQAFARDNLLLIDKNQNAYVSALRGEYLPERNMAYVEVNCHLWRVDTTQTDTLHIFSKKMEYYFKPIRKAIARREVVIQQGNMTANCDSAVYLVDREKAYLEIAPRAIQENNEMEGKKIELEFKDLEIKKIIVYGDARAVSVEDSVLKKENRLEGKKLIMFIENRNLKELWAISNARSIYYLKEEKKDQGINTATADTIRVYFKNSELDSISVIGGAQGIYYPANYKGPIKWGQ